MWVTLKNMLSHLASHTQLIPIHPQTCSVRRRSDPKVPPIIQRWQENNYTWGQPRSWACFRPDMDVLVPTVLQV